MIAQRKERIQNVSDFEAYFLQESENNNEVVVQSGDENLTEQIDIQKEEGKIYFSTCSFIIICVLICFTCILYCGLINRSLFLEIMTSGISLITGFVCLIGIFYTVTVCGLFTHFHELIKNKKIWLGVVTGSIGLFVLLYFYISFNTYDINYRNSITGCWNFSKLSSQSIETFTANGVSFEMVKVSGGKFFMGANVKFNNPNKPNTPRDDDGNSNESPAHIVTVGSFYIGRTEVTQELWQAVMGDNPSNFNGNKKPVEYVNWYDCQKFINKLNELTGENFRLPTEAEWEFAAKGGKESRGNKYSGSNNLADVAWYKDNSNSTTHEVCQKSPNELGIYDMSGNVSEWCHDGPRSYSVWGRPVNPIGANDSCRVVRGGSYTFDAKGCRSSFRNWNNLDSRFVNVGLRLALCK